MYALEKFRVRDQDLCLSADRSIFWENEKALIVSDLHFGKTGHFRKAGIAVPQNVFKEDIQRLVAQVQYFKPQQLIVVGDMFHSYANKELDLFAKWRNDFENLTIRLVKGNHDILQKRWYADQQIELHDHSLTMASFCFQHDPSECNDEEGNPYVLSGHIHPGITMNGIGKQTLRFPCFYFTETFCVLPAFSRFTGVVSVAPQAREVAFAIVNNSLVKVGGRAS
jgi:DNA ligase-associated metallophosphoesterase